MSETRDDDEQADQGADRPEQPEGAGTSPPAGAASRPEAQREADATIRSISRLEQSN